MKLLLCILILFLLPACKIDSKTSKKEGEIEKTVHLISGREEFLNGSLIKRPVYRALAPKNWRREDSGDLRDTRTANAIFFPEEEVKITVHSFPSSSLGERIPLVHQIDRWKKQMPYSTFEIQKVSQNGFYGLLLISSNEKKVVVASAMQLDPDHYQNLLFLSHDPEEKEYYRQMSSDYTIKASGSTSLIKKHFPDIQAFMNSFELIEGIPEKL